MHKLNIKNVTQIVTTYLHVFKTVIAYDKKSKPKFKNHITYGDQACKISDQLDQHITFHKAMNVAYQFGTRFNQKNHN